MPVHRRRFVPLAALLGLVASLLLGAGPVAAGARSYVALGDSYASGLGTRDYRPGAGACLRSARAYPVLVAARTGVRLSFRACAGAGADDVRQRQLGSLGAGTDLVTVQVGGNDAGFRSVITTCALPAWASRCGAAVDRARRLVRDTLPTRLDRLYTAVRRAAPHALVTVVGYPRLFNGRDCNAGTFFSPAEERRLNRTADLLDATLRSRADAHGFGFVDPVAAFTGHAVCDSPEWLNGLSQPLWDSYHPNRRGQRGYAALVAARLS